jgi:putative radical SAM enzyme (TIGR03279 family)
MKPYEIKEIAPGGVLAEMGVEKGDLILDIDGTPVLDELDIRFLGAEDTMTVTVQKPDGQIWELDIEKDEDEDLGLDLSGQTLGIRRCKNNCVFCFIDQMPPGMRETLYIKDDDERLSFLQGNYVTLTNLDASLKERIVRYHIMPINISIHTTDPDLRCKMLGNRFAGNIMEDLRYFSDHGIAMNGQIVLCPGYNDGEALQKTLKDLCGLYPQLASVSVVPVGLGRFRQNLPVLTPMDKTRAEAALQIIEGVQREMFTTRGSRFVFPSDELFLLAERPLPSADYYEDFLQIENGVGMMADFKQQLEDALKAPQRESEQPRRVGIITGTLAAPFMDACCRAVTRQFPAVTVTVYPVINHYFGESITVSGLVTGTDIMTQLAGIPAYDALLIPENMTRFGTSDLLDDVTAERLKETLGSEVRVISVDGDAFLNALLLG